ncbi:hypothetical protein [Pseudomonas psychrophila]|uniref:hypothetical protein n=1 Tax=Pseudomonas psychrophila TaxID=122355 RepID=UPI0012FE77F9|nr:hypothetical protein [Pseudomonas psychrophila]
MKKVLKPGINGDITNSYLPIDHDASKNVSGLPSPADTAQHKHSAGPKKQNPPAKFDPACTASGVLNEQLAEQHQR